LEFKVVKGFIDKNTQVTHRPGTDYSTNDKDRADQLKGLGFIKDKELKSTDNQKSKGTDVGDKKFKEITGDKKSILEKSAPEIIKKITPDTPKSELETLIKVEKKGKNRKSVVEHIESLMV
jgi:hypothetical protein